MAGKDYIFSVNMGQYDSMQEYNEVKSRQRQVDKKYTESADNEWEWDTTQNRIQFDRLRIKSITYEKYASFAIGGLLLHRIISLIDVIYLERKFPEINLTPQVSTSSGSLQFNLTLDI